MFIECFNINYLINIITVEIGYNDMVCYYVTLIKRLRYK